MKSSFLVRLVFFGYTASAPVLAYPQGVPVPPSTAKEEIQGAFGIKFGEDVRPYQEGHYANIGRMIEGHELLMSDRLRYRLLKPPKDMQSAFGTARLQYMALVNVQLQVVELLLEGNLRTPCMQSQEVVAVMEVLREKYQVVYPQPSNSVPTEKYGDGKSQIDLKCSSDRLSIRYTSDLFKGFVNELLAQSIEKKEEIKKSVKDGL